MKKENYKAIAEIIRKEIESISNSSMGKINQRLASVCPELIACYLADYFEKENPPFTQYFKKYGFDKKQFLKYCGV